MSKVLVAGATGFLGRALVLNLLADGVDVIATGRNVERLSALPLSEYAKFAVDLTDSVHLQEFRGQLSGVTQIVHCAALSSPWGGADAYYNANVLATENVIALAQSLAVERLVHISTPTVYFQFSDQRDVAEDMELPAPVNAYAATKAIAEDRVRASGVPAVILRPRGIYGAGDTALLPRLLRAARSGPLPLFDQGQAETDITHVSDVVAAIRAAMVAPNIQPHVTLNVSGGVPLKIKDVVDRVCAINDVPLRWRALPLRPCLAAVRLGERLALLRRGQPEPRVTAYGIGIFAFSQTLNIGAARDVLDWSPLVSLDQGLAETFPKRAMA